MTSLLRAPVDTNVLISLLLSPNPATSAAGLVIRAALSGRFTLLFPVGIADELDHKLVERPDLARRIPRQTAADLVAALEEVAEPVPHLEGPLRPICRDRKDDFVIAHAVPGGADRLGAWDRGLLDWAAVDGVRVVSPAAFLDVLRERGELPL